MSTHCPGCCGDSRPHIVQVSNPCPGVTCPTCATLTAERDALQAATRRLVEAALAVCGYPGPGHWTYLEDALADPVIVALRRT
jgi:hypothetical protein